MRHGTLGPGLSSSLFKRQVALCRIMLQLGMEVASDDISTWANRWGCLKDISPAVAETINRPDFRTDNTLRYIEELPLAFSSPAVALMEEHAMQLSCWRRAPKQNVSVPQQDAGSASECVAAWTASSPCFRESMTRVCAPLQPMYGAAAVAVPGLAAFIIFGGRAAVDQSDDLPACKQMLPRDMAWRFQYHRELRSPLNLTIDGPGVPLLLSSQLLLTH